MLTSRKLKNAQMLCRAEWNRRGVSDNSVGSSHFKLQTIICSVVNTKILITEGFRALDLNKTTCLNNRHKQITKAGTRP